MGDGDDVDMDKKNDQLVWKIWEAGQHDPKYRRMLAELYVLEKKYDAVLQKLPLDQQDTVCDFVMLCEEMSWRMLEFACEQTAL